MNQPKGRIYQFGCDAVVGDQRCSADLDSPAFRSDGVIVSAEDGRHFITSGASAFSENWFTRGTMQFTSGANAGRTGEIKFHRQLTAGAQIELWQPVPEPVGNGDAIILRAGCDKQFATCRSKFANGVNFRGFPHIPGDDFVLTYVSRADTALDGESRNISN